MIVNIIVVLGSNRMTAELSKRFSTERTSLGEPIHIIGLDRSEGVVERDEGFLEHSREQAIKEYFFGDARRALSPQIQQVDFDALVIYTTSDCESTSLAVWAAYRQLGAKSCEIRQQGGDDMC